MTVPGCAGFGKFTPTGGAIATYAVDMAGKLLATVDFIYPLFLDAKNYPDWLTEATQQLAVLDKLAPLLKEIIAGATVTDEKLNVLAGQVSGAESKLRQMLQK
jgi:hypothetical protein